ncbi:uncharacterized protein [Clytia hemisphaerica]|uniref:glutathione gamma-glutamylcysteinyltransferase n=1 Tax=Clytia hemisphaerica TaxID=252671 RepID=A0A7M5V0G5_9CNID
MTTFTPRLDRIIEDEESSKHPDDPIDFDDNILEEYDLLTEQDLFIALEINPKKFKDGEYLNGVTYKKDGDDQSEDDDSNFTESGDEFDGCHSNGPSTLSNGHNGAVDHFSKLHSGTQAKNFEIMQRYQSPIDCVRNTSSSADSANNDEVSSMISDSSSLSKISRRRKISGHSNPFSPITRGQDLLKKYLSNYEGYEFDSKNGRKIFVKAILKKYMTMYYVISPPQITAADLDNSGVSTLLAIRNALKIKEDKLVTEQNGGDNNDSLITSCLMFDYQNNDELNFDEFACIAKLNALNVEAVVAHSDSNIKEFRRDIKLSCQTDSRICVCYYTSNDLFQCSGSYFTLVGGYSKEKDLVLLFDASSHKIPPFWIPLPILFKSIQSKPIDETNIKEFKLGYFLLEKSEKKASILLNINKKISVLLNAPDEHYEKLCNMKDDWEMWLISPLSTSRKDDILRLAVDNIMEIIKKQTLRTVRVKEEQAKLTYKQGSLVDSLTKTKIFPVIEKFVSNMNNDSLSKLTIFSEWVLETVFIMRKSDKNKNKFAAPTKKKKKKLVRTNVNMNTFNNTTMLATWLLFWPYAHKKFDSNSTSLSECIENDLKIFPSKLVETFHHQMDFVIKVVQSSTMNVVKRKARKNGTLPHGL